MTARARAALAAAGSAGTRAAWALAPVAAAAEDIEFQLGRQPPSPG